MDVYKNKTVPAKKKTIVKTYSHTVCDICKKDTDAKLGSYDVDGVKIEREVGTSYPGDYNTSTIDFDLCGDCFEEHLTPFLKSKGCDVYRDGEIIEDKK